MKRVIYCILIFTIIIISGCSKKETIEEKLIAQNWSATFSDGSATMKFYKNGTAIAETPLFEVSYEWSLEESLLTMITNSGTSICTMIFTIEDDENEGYICTLNEITSDPNIAYDNQSYSKTYSTMKLTPKK